MRISYRLGLSFLIIAFFFPLIAHAQDDVTSRRVNLRGSAAEVLINQVDTSNYPQVTLFATVLREGEPVIGLGAGDFRVREDEVDQEPLTVIPKLSSLHAAVTVDTSGSIRKALPQIKVAAKSFLQMLEENDRFNVLAFAREVRILSSSGDRLAAEKAIDATVARGDTALYDAVYKSIEVLAEQPGRKAIVLLTDGVDDDGRGGQLSKHSVDDALALAKKVNVPIFSIGLGTEKDEATLKKIASGTGGRYFDAPSVEQLQSIYNTIGRQLTGQYTINYTSNLPADGTIHRVSLAHGEVTGFKEYTSPETAEGLAAATASKSVVVASPPEPVKPLETKRVTLISEAPGLHVAAIPTEGADWVEFKRVEVFHKPKSSFEKRERALPPVYGKKTASFQLKPGAYLVEVTLGSVTSTEEVTLTAGESRNLVVNLNAGRLRVAALMKEGGARIVMKKLEVFKKAASSFDKPIRLATCYNKEICEFVLPAGELRLQATRGKAQVGEEVQVLAGEQTDLEMVLGAGSLRVRAVLTEGGPSVEMRKVNVLLPSASGFDKPKFISSCSYNKEQCEFTLSAGRTIVEVQRGAVKRAQEVEVKSGEKTDLLVVLNAGDVRVRAAMEKGGPSVLMRRVTVYKPAASDFDKPTSIANCNYNKKVCEFTLPSGKAIIEITRESGKTQTEVDVVAGEEMDLEVVLRSQAS